MKLWTGVQKQWAVIGVILAIGTTGYMLANYINGFNMQMLALTIQVEKLTIAVEKINGMDERITELENTTGEYRNLIINRAVVIVVNMEAQFGYDVRQLPSAKAELQFVCESEKYKTELTVRVGESLTNKYCNLVAQ